MCSTDKKAGRWEEEEEEVDGKTSEIPPPPSRFSLDGGSRQGEICESGGCRDGFFFHSPVLLFGLYHETHIPYTLIKFRIIFLLNNGKYSFTSPPP